MTDNLVERVVQEIRMNVVTPDDSLGLLRELIRQVAVLVDMGAGTEGDADELSFIGERIHATMFGDNDTKHRIITIGSVARGSHGAPPAICRSVGTDVHSTRRKHE